MSSLVAVLLLIAGVGLVIAGAEALLDGLVASAARLGVSAFAITVAISGFELENLAAGTTFLALGVAGLAAIIAPIRARLPGVALAWTAVGPLPVVALGLDGTLSRLDGTLLLLWFVVALLGLIRAGRHLLEPERPERRPHPIAWLLGVPEVTAVIVGPNRAERLEPVREALSLELTTDDLDHLRGLFA